MRRVKVLRLHVRRVSEVLPCLCILTHFHQRVPIRTQLHLEEAIFRNDTENTWLILNHGSTPAVIMGKFQLFVVRLNRSYYTGLGGKLAELVNSGEVKRDLIPVIRRFSGGGTVYGRITLPTGK